MTRKPAHDILLSYSKDDIDRAKPLAEALRRRGWSVVWERELPPGKLVDEVIPPRVDAARCVVALCSERAVESRWVRAEAKRAAARGVLIPARLDHAVAKPLGFNASKVADLSDWHGQRRHAGFEAVAKAISATLGETADDHADTEQRTRPRRGWRWWLFWLVIAAAGALLLYLL